MRVPRARPREAGGRARDGGRDGGQGRWPGAVAGCAGARRPLAPAAPAADDAAAGAARARYVLQQHGSRRGEWSPQRWALELGVLAAGRPVGMVVLTARDFPVLREVRTESWLGVDHHRRGPGTQARTALLHLAFDHLGARSAVSEVLRDDAASQGMSRTLGYRPDGVSRDVLHGAVVVSDRLRLDPADWRRVPRAEVAVHGLAGCPPLFAADAGGDGSPAGTVSAAGPPGAPRCRRRSVRRARGRTAGGPATGPCRRGRGPRRAPGRSRRRGPAARGPGR